MLHDHPTTNRDTSTELCDTELITLVRSGHTAAYGSLFSRHRPAAVSLARQLTGQGDADDLVSEAFIRVQRVLSAGGGPDTAFRAYLLTAVRRLHVDKIRAEHRITLTDDVEKFDRGTCLPDPVVQEFEHSVAARALATLPERWQQVLWHVEIEGHKPADVAPLLGITPNSVSALAYRAREGLRLAYLRMQLHEPTVAACRWTTDRMGAYLRSAASADETTKLEAHLDSCARCAGVYLELSEMNAHLARPAHRDVKAPAAAEAPRVDLADTENVTRSLRAKLRLAQEQVGAAAALGGSSVASAVVSQTSAVETENLPA